jgi:hypothetical protein
MTRWVVYSSIIGAAAHYGRRLQHKCDASVARGVVGLGDLHELKSTDWGTDLLSAHRQ